MQTLVGLPEELIALVATELNSEDFFSYRQVSNKS